MIILIGFKHVGKSVIGRALAESLQVPFMDLDDAIEAQQKQSCRDLVKTKGEAYFRQVETTMLTELMQIKPEILALGGGTPMDPSNQKLIQGATIIYLMAARKIVFDRIMSEGSPSFFIQICDPWLEFNRLWDAREPVYRQLASITVENEGSIEDVVMRIKNAMH